MFIHLFIVHACMHMYVHTCMRNTHMHACMHTYRRETRLKANVVKLGCLARSYIHTYLHIYIHAHAHTTYIHTYIYTHRQDRRLEVICSAARRPGPRRHGLATVYGAGIRGVSRDLPCDQARYLSCDGARDILYEGSPVFSCARARYL
jgi:hypothetical protein